MKKIITCVAVAAIFGMTSCNNQPQKNDAKGTATPAAATAAGAQKIAIVEYDSIQSQYQFAKDAKQILEGKDANISKVKNEKEKAIAQAEANFNQRMQQNKFKSQQEAEAVYNNIQKQKSDAAELLQRLSGELQQEYVKYSEAMSDSIHHYLAVYNKDRKYSLILSKQGDNILYADKTVDITNEVVAGLNKAYKGMKK